VVIVSGLCLVYYAAIMGLWVLLGTVGDRWWFATVVMYGPRWIWAMPFVILTPAAVVIRPKLLWLLAIAGVVVIGPVMGFCVPWATMEGKPAGAFSIHVLTCNAGGGNLRPGALAELIAATRPDVVALQEGSVRSLPAECWPVGWQLRTTVASRYPIRKIEKLGRDNLGGDGFVTRFDLDTPGGLVHFFNLHLEIDRGGRRRNSVPTSTCGRVSRKRPAAGSARFPARS
jgi:vancomycin resistance protein VanJ